MNKVVAFGIGASLGAITFGVGRFVGETRGTHQMDRPVPVVVTNDGNVVVDMPSGVQWNVLGLTEPECDHAGGEYADGMCKGIDF